MKKLLRPIIANFGEFKAKHYLIKKGYKIITTNWRLKYGELDIVAVDKNELVFIEVKTRKAVANEAFLPADAVNYKKISKIRIISDYYIDRNQSLIKNLNIKRIRYDVIGITLHSPIKYSIEHRIDAF